jgi:hypothetical protein
MTVLVSGTNAAEAWIRGCAKVSDDAQHTVRNLITEIENPIFVDPAWFGRFDPKAVGAADRLSVVAKVLFPSIGKKATETRQEFFDRYERLLSRSLKSGKLRSSWGGTYFQRLRSLDGSEDQIDHAIYFF